MPATTQHLLEASVTHPKYLELQWSDGKKSHFHYLWLRDNCATTLHPDTKERIFNQLEVSAEIHPISATVKNDSLHILWSEQNHESTFSGQWLREHAYSRDLTPENYATTQSWDSNFINNAIHSNYETLIADDKALYEWMKQLDRDGLVFVENMPSTAEALTVFAHCIDYQRQTNFGLTFEVKSEANPINLAYTSLALPLHTDLPNQETPPGYQFLHCLANETDGGESLYVDGLRVLEDLRTEAPAHFELLATHAIPFRFHDADHDIYHHHPVINLDHLGNIVEIKYNAHIAEIFDLPESVMHEYYVAYRDLMQRLQLPKYQIQIKLVEGMMAVFDNRRVLHGRQSYEATGKRHLRGCYVDRTEFKSRLRVLAKRYTS
jgi:gamma-butyrobetaine dioxygenase